MHAVREECILIADVEGKPMSVDASVVDRIGSDDRGRAIDVLFGALGMRKWGVLVCPDTESLDLTHYPKEFVEF